MQLNVPCKTLYSNVSAVSKVINPKNSLAILDNFLFELDGDTLSISGSDMENSLTCRVPVTDASSEGKFCFCLPAKRLVDLLKELPDQGITLRVNEESLEVEIEYTGGKYTLVAIDGKEYPDLDGEPTSASADASFTIEASRLLKGIDYTIFAVGDDDYRPMMKGIFFDMEPDKLSFVATDTHKLVRYIDSKIKPGFKGSCILPVKPATVIRNVLAKESELRFTLTSKNAIIESEKVTFRCALLNGRFPDYNRVIPKNAPYRLTVDRLGLLNAVRRVGVFVDPGYGLEKFRIGSDVISIKSDDNNLCTCAREQVPCSFTGPADLVIGFSAPYVIEFLSTLPTQEVYIDLSDPSRAGVFCPSENEEDTDLVMLLMPMNVDKF